MRGDQVIKLIKLTSLTSSGSTEEQRAGDRFGPRERRTVVKTLREDTNTVR